MPIPECLKNIKRNFSASGYFDFKDNPDTPTKGCECIPSSTGIFSATISPAKNLSVSAGAGYTTNFDDNGLVLECKGTYSYDKNADVQLRIRSSHSPSNDTTQIRLSPGVKYPITPTTTLYANPYIAAKIDYRKKDCTMDYGCFVGLTQSFGERFKVSAEVQKYSTHIGANVIATIIF